MEFRRLGKTELTLPRIVFGATSLGNLFRAVSDHEKSGIFDAWFRRDFSPIVIDSAGKYGAGLSLEVIGRELNKRKIPPEKVVISNKLAWRRIPLLADEPTFEPGAWFGIKHDAVQDISYDGILRCWEEGNLLLNGYSAKMVSVHDPDEYLASAADAADRERRLRDISEAYRALGELKAAGKVAAVGVGAKDWTAIQEVDRLCDLDWVMFANSFTIMHHPPELAKYMSDLADRGITIINSALFHGGFLLGGDFFDYRPLEPDTEADRQRIRYRDKLVEVCARHQQTVFDVGVAFGLSHPAISAVALSTSRGERVRDQEKAVMQVMPKALWQELRRENLVDPSYPYLC